MDFPRFAVAVGEEGSDPLVWHDGAEVRVDEFEASGHFEHRDADLAAVASLGVRVLRYGMPWRLTEPEAGVYDWRLWDDALAACERHGLEPVIDLCHFGLPGHYAGFGDAAWVEGFCRYVDAFLARYRQPQWFTPVNEPGITAMLSALLGLWNDRQASLEAYFVALGNVVLANLEALARVRADRDGWWVGAEGFGCELADPADERGVEAAGQTRALQQAVWDLHFGIEPRAGAAALREVIAEPVQERISDLAVPHRRMVAGHDFYPTGVTRHGALAVDAEPLTIPKRVAAYEAEAGAWHARYGRHFWVAETSNLGLPVADQEEWLAELSAGLERLVAAGLPVRGLCWYSRGDQFDWDTALAEPVGKVTEVGLFDAGRRARPVAAAFATLAARSTR